MMSDNDEDEPDDEQLVIINTYIKRKRVTKEGRFYFNLMMIMMCRNGFILSNSKSKKWETE